jgi:hypothetical protein
VARESWFSRLIHHFHEHPHGRLHEFFFWAGLGLALGAVALVASLKGKLSDPLALMLGLIAVCLVGWSLLPRAKQRAAPPPPMGKRGAIQAAVRKNKAAVAKKKKGPGPPIQ